MVCSPSLEILPPSHSAAEAPTVYWHLQANIFVFASFATQQSQGMQGTQSTN